MIMASSVFISYLLFASLLSLSFGFERKVGTNAASRLQNYHAVPISSLFPSTICSPSTKGKRQSCYSPTSPCMYTRSYGDRSQTTGYLSRETITLRQYDNQVLEDFLFGCGVNNGGVFGLSAGLLGLSRGKLSFVEQSAQKYNRTFSYCLPTSSSSSGFLTFGKAVDKAASADVKYIPLTTVSEYFYGVKLDDIILDGIPLGISPVNLFSSPVTIIDSGTVITRLPETAYRDLRFEFRRYMEFQGYTLISPISILDTCYDLNFITKVHLPIISFLFADGTMVELDPNGIFYVFRLYRQGCLAFAGFPDYTGHTILGNTIQRTMEVVYDIDGGRIGFRSSACE
nr:aspartyl protease family protein At5g10770-like [Ziziphus jujuba var. spinosa]